MIITILFAYIRKNPKTQEKKVYLYSEKNKRMLECDLETLGNLQKDGLTFGRTGREEGVKILEKTLYKMEKEKKKRKNNKIDIQKFVLCVY